MVYLTPQERSLTVFVAVAALGGALFLMALRWFPSVARASAFIDRPLPIALTDINTADYDQLVAVSGIGPLTARRILAERQARGAFRNPADLRRVRGFSTNRIRCLQGSIIFGSGG